MNDVKTQNDPKVTRFLFAQSGATLAEYGVALVVAIIVGSAAIGALATAVSDELSETANAF